VSASARNRMKRWEIMADNLSKAAWSCQLRGDFRH
jgi:hypothetical protein